MGHPYKIIVSSNNIHREFEIREDVERVSLGTNSSCEFRLNADDFFTPIEIAFVLKDGQWYALCDENLYLNFDDVRKLRHNKINHGDRFQVRYANNGAAVFDISFAINFEVQIPSYNRKIEIPAGMDIRLGTPSPSVEVELHSEYCSDTLAVISNDNGKYILREDKSRYGINVNGTRITKPTVLRDHDFFSISDVFFYFKGGSLYTDDSKVVIRGVPHELLEKSTFNYPVFVRNTRRKIEPDLKPINILDPSKKPTKPELNILTSLLPMVMMIVLIVVVRGFMSSTGGSFIIFSVCSMGLGVVTSIISMVQGQKKYKKDIAERERIYTKYIEDKESEIKKARQEETDILREMYRSQDESAKKVMDFESDIFDRIPEDDDYMEVLLGYGRRKAQKLIEYKKKEKLEEDDEMTLIPEQVSEKYQFIDDAPITVSLRKANAVGITGNETERYEFFKTILTDLICRQFSNEMEFFLLFGDDAEKYEWIKRLPQLQRPGGKRNIVFDSNSRTNTFDYLYKELSTRAENEKYRGKSIVVFTLDNNGIYNHPISKYIQNAAKLDTTFIFFETSVDYLPLHCSEIVELKDENKGVLYKSSNRTDSHEFTYTRISDERIKALVEKIAPVYSEEISLASSLRKSYSMYEMLNIYNAADIDLSKNWQESEVFRSMAAPLGINSKDEIVYLDLHEKAHGPHGLVAGTTGSGKSEILQTYIMSMAAKYHPYEVSFVIIDFKGGGMANQMADLPHMIGAITNIDGKEIDRSLKSIKAELLKRQALFAEAGVNHIDKYIKAYKEGRAKTALPHLIIIVDEFAELKAEQPEFMKELISASRIGRSLGVHLILATQKPAGQVNEQIWSNSRFKLCLKVQTQEDSNEVIKSPVAAEIREPGRAYMQVGNNEIFELLQSAYSGGPALRAGGEEKPFRLFTTEMSGREAVFYDYKPGKKESVSETELDALVAYINGYCKKENISRLPNICLPPLPETIPAPTEKMLSAEGYDIGIYDNPDSQFQGPAYVDIDTENTVIVGSSQTGKTNLLQLLIKEIAISNSSDDANIYVADFGSMTLKNFAELDHVGGIVTASEEEKFKNLIKLLLVEVETRKEKFAEKGLSSFAAYKEAGYRDLPHIYFMLDNYPVFKELYSEKYDDDFIFISRECISCGISMIVTTPGLNGFSYRYLSNFANRIALQCNDIAEYSNLFDRCRIQPSAIRGRGLFSLNKELFELQTYLAFAGEKEIDRANAIRSFIAQNNSVNNGRKAKRIPEVPDSFTLEYISDNFKYDPKKELSVALNYQEVEPVTLDFYSTPQIALAGSKETNMAAFVRSILSDVRSYYFDRSTDVYIVDSLTRDLGDYSDEPYIKNYSIDYSQVDGVFESIDEILRERYDSVISNGMDSIREEPLILFIINNIDAIKYISESKPLMEIYNNIITRYKAMKIMLVFSNIPDEAIGYSSADILKKIKDARNAFIFSNITEHKIFDIPTSFVRQNKKPIDATQGFYIRENDIYKIRFLSGGED